MALFDCFGLKKFIWWNEKMNFFIDLLLAFKKLLIEELIKEMSRSGETVFKNKEKSKLMALKKQFPLFKIS